MNNVIAVDIGGTHFRVGLFDEEGRRLLVNEHATLRDGGRDWMLQQVRDHCRGLVEKSDYPVTACGVSFGGPVDFERQRVTSLHAPGWEDFPLGEWTRETLGLPCRLDNDANAGALGEFRYGAGRGLRSLVYVTISTGIGGGLISDGRLIRGRDSMAGEIGHLPVSENGVLCSCGARGCLETFCSGTAIAQRGQEWATRRPESVARMIEMSGGVIENITAQAVVQAAAEGNMAAEGILREVGRWLGRALLVVIRLLNPDKIVLGGGVAQAGKLLIDPVHEALDELKSPTIRYSTEIVLAELGTFSPLYGAAALALEAAPSQA
ncbi:MAG: ROK family protein [Acidobacteriia bacterium]|nr:ROK family protein [Terriglobia bacterium]